MSNGAAPDDFVFPPFVPPATPPSNAATPPPLPEAQPAPPAKPVMPWDVATPLVGDGEDAPAAADEPEPAAADEPEPAGSGEELPWLELPEPREGARTTEEPADAPAAEGGEPLPEWMTWDSRDETAAEEELSVTGQLEGLESFGLETPPASPEEARDVFPYGEPDAGPAEADFPFGIAPGDVHGAGFDAGLEAPPEPEPAGTEPAGGGREARPAAERGEEPPFVGAPPTEQPFGASPEPWETPPDATGEREADLELARDMERGTEPAGGGEMDVEVELEEPLLLAEASALEEVASRLEGIARELRERPDALLSGRTDDDLGRLVTAYALGYVHGRRV
jgi:hypothetical protein